MTKNRNKLNTPDEFKTDLELFKSALFSLFKENIQGDLSKIISDNSKSLDNWICSKTDLKFLNIDLGQKVFPSSATRGMGKIKLSISCEGISYDRQKVCNPLKKMEINILIEVTRSIRGTDKPLKSLWHLDKHSDTQAGDEKQGDEKFLHPEYHFQFGGKYLTEDENISSNILIINSPRIQYFPMDIILAIDFIVHNFYSKEQRHKLISDKRYIKVVQNAKHRLWRPYIYAMADSMKFPDEDFFNLDIDSNFQKQIFG
jgi:hypothetical protein